MPPTPNSIFWETCTAYGREKGRSGLLILSGLTLGRRGASPPYLTKCIFSSSPS